MTAEEGLCGETQVVPPARLGATGVLREGTSELQQLPPVPAPPVSLLPLP